jgi:hypothetical protein
LQSEAQHPEELGVLEYVFVHQQGRPERRLQDEQDKALVEHAVVESERDAMMSANAMMDFMLRIRLLVKTLAPKSENPHFCSSRSLPPHVQSRCDEGAEMQRQRVDGEGGREVTVRSQDSGHRTQE